jgi:hypothetical protein
VRIDVLTEITGVRLPDAWRERVESTFFGIPVNFISLVDLAANKQALGRNSDLKDLKHDPKITDSEEVSRRTAGSLKPKDFVGHAAVEWN